MAESRNAARAEREIHYMPADGRRFPFCGSWRSNWNHTPDPDRATCGACRVRLPPRSTRPAGAGEP